MTQNTKMQKTQKTQTRVFVQNCKRNRNGNICVLCHNFWSNQNVDLLSTSKWPSEPQFCERWTYIRQKRARYGRSNIRDIRFHTVFMLKEQVWLLSHCQEAMSFQMCQSNWGPLKSHCCLVDDFDFLKLLIGDSSLLLNLERKRSNETLNKLICFFF